MKASQVPVLGDVIYVVCADVLGFKQLVANNKLIDIVMSYGVFLGDRSVAGHLDWAAGRAFLPGHLVDDGARHGAAIDYAVFSDTVLLWTRNATLKSLAALLDACILVVAAGLTGPHLKLPFRAGIAKGIAYIEPEAGIYVGNAIVDAYQTEQLQDWVGATLAGSISDAELKAALAGKLQARVVPHDVPVHPDRVGDGSKAPNREMRALNWPIGIGSPSYVELVLTQLANDAGDKHRHKYDHALAFYRRYSGR